MERSNHQSRTKDLLPIMTRDLFRQVRALDLWIDWEDRVDL